MKVVILGGGIVGVSIAYHLAKRGVTSTIVERCEPACAASGKAGGFLARDWCDSYELGPLANKSYDMHMAFANDDRFKGCDYRCLDTLGISVRENYDGGRHRSLPEWLDGSIVKSSVMGTLSTTAQVHPYKLTHTMLRHAIELVGTDVKIGIVQGVEMDDKRKVTGVRVSEEFIPADVVVVALGPWSVQAISWFDLPPIQGQRAHSVIIQPSAPISAHALFVEFGAKAEKSRSPEVYPRPDGTVYLCGMSDRETLPDDPSKIAVSKESCERLKFMASHFSSAFKQVEVLSEQACYLPMSPDGLPLIGAIPNTTGAYVATGHSCWGILTGPGTGEAMAQLIVDGSCSFVDLSPFDPARFMS